MANRLIIQYKPKPKPKEPTKKEFIERLKELQKQSLKPKNKVA